ncbi:sodium:proton antiporter [Lentilactobacillus senioris]|uniref:cation:proton antiporter n=1 Tax=Lentilactobacillus senioris TaxID=931534 RepID=UPI00227F812C|nr:sodium:proton antiporter [Lentilactobacillus senioris]MCY9807420.1 sodium:proton antiporter [Lentilactobacillus senioris]
MTATFFVLILLLGVVTANVVGNHIKWLPLPMLYIISGLLLAIIPFYRHFLFNPELFMFLVVTPLLYNDAQNASRYWISRGAINILSLSILLVVTTVLVVGGLINWLFPLVPLALAFTICAIVTPTDASAVSAFAQPNPKFQIPFLILQNESLFNDATGFVAFSLALSAFMEGNFTWSNAISLFLVEFLGGLLLGAVIGIVFHHLRRWLISSADDSPLIMIVLELTVPFLVYYLAEELELSGILAIVAAGLVQGVENDNLRFVSTKMQLVKTNVWEILEHALTGIIFILLGLSLPTITMAISEQHKNLLGLLVLIGVSLYAFKFVIRLLWTRYLVWMHIKSPHRWQDSWLMAISGASGTISLSLAFLIPTNLAHSFIDRNSLIFIVAVIILLSLTVAAIFVPLITKATPDDTAEAHKHQWLREMVMVAMNKVKQQAAEHPAESQLVTDALSQQLHQHSHVNKRRLRQIYQLAYNAELAAIKELEQSNQITAVESHYYQEFISMSLYTVNNNLLKNFWLRVRFGVHTGRMSQNLQATQNMFLTSPLIAEQYYWKREFDKHGEDFAKIEDAGYHAAERALRTSRRQHKDTVELHLVQRFYLQRHRRINYGEPDPVTLYQTFLLAFHSEYEFMQQAISAKKLTVASAQTLQEHIVYDEMAYLQNNDAFTPQ